MAAKKASANEKKAAAAVLLLARRAGKDASDTADDAVDSAVAGASKRGAGKKASILAAILVVSSGFAGDLKKSLLASRKGARDAARSRLAWELGTLAVAVPTALRGPGKARPEDETYAETAADSAATAWRAAAIAAVSRAVRREESVTEALEGTRKTALARAELAARTETAVAYNEEHALAVREAAENDPKFAGALREAKVVRVWNSALEDRTCDRCAHQHGDTAALDGSYPSGDEPGSVHPRCLCTEYLSTET